MIPKTIFITDPTREAEYICYLAKSISMGFYANSGYLLLPYQVHKNYQTSYFPDLNYSKNFWSAIIKSKNCHYGQGFPKEAIKEVRMNNTIKTTNTNVKKQAKIAAVWEAKASGFFNTVTRFLDAGDVVSGIKSIEILLTDYGTAGTIFPSVIKGGYKISMTQRSDMPADMIGKTLLIAIDRIRTYRDGTTGDRDWFTRQSNIEYLLGYTVFTKILPEISREGITNHSMATKLISDSDKYQEKLGFPVAPIVTAKNGKIMMHDLDISGLFTKAEALLLMKLASRPHEVLTFDEAAEAIWKDEIDSKFSLYALAKTVENIRRKLKNQGIYKEIIRTQRGAGYVLG